MPKKDRFTVTMPEGFALDVESEFHRLHQEVLKLKKKGIIPKSRKFDEAQVKKFVVRFGYETLKKVDYETFFNMLAEEH